MIELGTANPNLAGSEYSYLKKTFGSLVAFPIAVILGLCVYPIANAMVLLTCGDYLLEAFNVFDERYSKLIAVGLTLILLIVNIQGVKWMQSIQVLFTVAKLVAIAIISITGIVRLCQGHTKNFVNAFEGKQPSVADVALGFYAGMWAYGGWENLNFAVQEMRDPKRDLPRVMWISLPFVCLCYILVNIGYLTLLTPLEIAQSNATAVVLSKQLYGVMSLVIPLLVGCSTFGSANGGMYYGSRLIYSLSLDGYVPRMLGMLNRKRHTPVLAVLLFALISVIVLIPDSSNFSTLLNYLSFLNWLTHMCVFGTILIERKTKPELHRPYKVFLGIPIVTNLCSIYLVLAPLVQEPWNGLYCAILLLVTVVTYVLFVWCNLCPTSITAFTDTLTTKLCKWLDCEMPQMKTVPHYDLKYEEGEEKVLFETAS